MIKDPASRATEARSGRARLQGDPDPYSSYAYLREHVPISQVGKDTGHGTTWLVTSYDLCHACLTDPRLSSDSRNAAADDGNRGTDAIARNFLGLDPPEHSRLRGVVSAPFSARAVDRFRPRIAGICAAAIDSFISRGSADVAREYALVVPVAVIHEILGIPKDRQKEPVECFDLFWRSSLGPQERGANDVVAAYLDELIGYKRAHRGEDLTSALIGDLERGSLRDENELRASLFIILGAGHTTTFPLIGSAILRTLQLGVTRELLADDPARCRQWIDEILRYDSPVQASQRRYAVTDLTVGGVHVAAGDTVIVSFAAANRDPRRFDHAEQIRQDSASRAHLAFGHGTHFCLGAHLARAEGEIALRSLLRAIPDLRLAAAPEEVAWGFGAMMRGPRELPVEFIPRR
jgi:cytochrome P450